MEFNDEVVKRIRGLIVFAALVVLCFWRYDIILDVIRFIIHVIFPFLLGGAIAFVLNVPMNFIQRHLFKPERIEGKKYLQKLARPVSMLLVLFGVIGVIALVMLVLVPQLGETFINLGRNIQRFIPKLQVWAAGVFHDNPDMIVWINDLKFDWNKIMDTGINFFTQGAGNVLNSTITAARSIVSGLTTFFIAFVFSIYILLQKEKLTRQCKRVMYAFMKKSRAEATLEVLALTNKTFSSFLTGQCVEALILGSMFVVAMTILNLPYALLVGIVIAVTALIPIFGAFIGCVIGAFLIFMVNPLQALGFIVLFLVLQQNVVGGSVGLPSIWVLAAVSIGGSLMGIVGMLIFIPIVSVVYALFREIVYLKLKQKKLDPGDIE